MQFIHTHSPRVRLPFLKSLKIKACFLLCTWKIRVAAVKPVKDLQVSFRGQTITVRGASTVEELARRVQEASGGSDQSFGSARALWNGKMLKPGESLSEAGVQPGDRVLVVPEQKQCNAQDALAMYLFLISEGSNSLDKIQSSLAEEQIEQLQEVFKDVRETFRQLTRKDVTDSLRNGFDVAYHRLRSWWEHPSLRRGLHDPDRIETYRKVVNANMSPALLKITPSGLQHAIKSEEIWRRDFLRIASNVIRLGDTILDGVLDLLLDVLKGKGSKYASQGPKSTSEASHETQPNPFSSIATDPRVDNPSLANDLLYELSESDEDDE